jgi:two-component system chemotaxis response regulator CheB
MSLPPWFGKNREEVLELKVSPGSVMLVLVSSQPALVSLATVLSEEQIEHFVKNSELFSNWMRSIGSLLSPATTFRLLGNKSEFAKLSLILSAFQLKSGNHISIGAGQGSLFQFIPQEGRIRISKTISPVKPLDIGFTASSQERKTRVLVVDDSETIRKLLSRIINEDPQMECVATVEAPSQVAAAIEKHKPDVITLDIHMPEMDGVTLLKKLLPKYLIPTVMISALSKEDGTFVLDALEAGAVDYIQKPSFAELKILAPMICEKIRSARFSKVQKRVEKLSRTSEPPPIVNVRAIDFSYLIVIGSSTGGTEALKNVLTRLPEKIPPILIVQHIPPVFSKAFADRMNQLCPFEVKEAEDGELVQVSKVLIAPGGRQMSVREVKGDLKIVIDDSDPGNRHKPSVDVLFDSVAALQRKKVSAAILTGMGSDGARSLLKLRQNGARTLAQDEATSVVFGMPKEALKMGGAEEAVPLDEIATRILEACGHARRGSAA